MVYQQNKAASRIKYTKPTLTDQSQAASTDINIVLKQFRITGQAAVQAGTPLYEDWTNHPRDLRELLDQSRNLNKTIRNLPKPLQEIPLSQLIQLTPTQVRDKLIPPAPTPATPNTPT